MTDQHRPGKDIGNRGQEPPGLSAQELRDRVEARRGRFLAAARRATALNAGLERRNRLVQGWAMAAAGFLIICGVFLMARQPGDGPWIFQVAQAGECSRIDGVVISKYDRTPLSGVEIREASLTDADAPGRFVTITDPQGSFELNSDTDRASVLKCRYNGEEVGQLIVGKDSGVAGYQEIPLDVLPEQQSLAAPVMLEPGGSCEPLPGIRVSLAAVAAGPWEGKLVHDMKWPAVFTFGLVLAGIYSLEGPASDCLEIQVAINPELPREYGIDPRELNLISYREEYRTDPWELSEYRSGWYVTDSVNAVDCDTYGLIHVVPRIEAGDEIQVSWAAVPGELYAIKTPVLADGVLRAGVRDYYCMGEVYDVPGYCLSESVYPRAWLYDLRYLPPGSVKEYTKGGHLIRALPDFYLDTYWTLDHELYSVAKLARGECLGKLFPVVKRCNGWMLHPLVIDFCSHLDDCLLESVFLGEWSEVNSISVLDYVYGRIPGEISCLRHDFTMTDPVRFQVDTSGTLEPAGSYQIQADHGEIGQMIRLSITGSLELLDGRVEWDFHADGTTDAYGSAAELLIPAVGSYKIRATIRERSGALIIKERVVHFPFEGCLGYFWLTMVQPVSAGRETPPENSWVHRVLSRYSVSSPMAYGTRVTSYLGPWLYVEPPADWIGTELSEIRTCLQARAVNHGAEEMWVDTSVFAVSRRNPPESGDGLSRFSVMTDYQGSESGRIDQCTKRWAPKMAIELYDSGDKGAAYRFIDTQLGKHPNAIALYKKLYGIDLLNLPPEDELVRRLREFHSRTDSVMNYTVSEMKPLNNRILLNNSVLERGQGFMIGHKCHDGNFVVAGQWEIMSGGDDPSRVELVAADGRVYTVYYDFSALE